MKKNVQHCPINKSASWPLTLIDLYGHFKVTTVKMAVSSCWLLLYMPKVHIDTNVHITQLIKVHLDRWPDWPLRVTSSHTQIWHWMTFTGYFKVTKVKSACGVCLRTHACHRTPTLTRWPFTSIRLIGAIQQQLCFLLYFRRKAKWHAHYSSLYNCGLRLITLSSYRLSRHCDDLRNSANSLGDIGGTSIKIRSLVAKIDDNSRTYNTVRLVPSARLRVPNHF